MSLLLDALQRAGAAREGSVAEKLAPADPGRAGAQSQWPEAAPTAGRARAEAVFRGGSAGHPRLRAGVLFLVLGLLLVGLGVFALWYYQISETAGVDRSLARYIPESAAASEQPPLEPVATPDRLIAADVPGEPSATPAAAAGATGSSAETPRAADTGGGVDGGDIETSPAPGESVDATGDVSASAAKPTADEAKAAPPRQPDPSVTSETVVRAGDAAATPTAAAEDNGRVVGNPDAARTRSGGSQSAPSTAASSNAAASMSVEAGSQPVVRRKTAPSALGAALHSGYQALQTGDLAQARADYARALETAPTNRDALLGAAAVAARQGRREVATAHYRQVLSDHPRDPYARAGLAGLQQPGDARGSESELKSRLRESPDAHALRFALGNVYARQNRWAEAQDAYFEAFRDAPEEADYAFNLAVALDHLDQRKPARKYYRRALALAEAGATSFSQDIARRRLELLDR